MDFNRTSKPSYDSRPTSGEPGKSGKISNDVKALWEKYIRDGPLFDFQKFEHALRDIRSQGNDAKYLENVREVFMEELDRVKSFSQKFARKIMDKIGSRNVTDSQVLDYVSKQGKKKGLNDTLVEACVREVTQILSERPSRTPYFRYNPGKNTKVSKSLGYLGADSYEHFADQNNKAIKSMDDTKIFANAIHTNAISQSMAYEDCGREAVGGGFNKEKHDKYIHIHPVMAALFIPKIRLLEEMMVFASITNVVLSRSKNEPISTRPDYELFYNMVHDKNESVCDFKDPLNDLKLRSEIQVCLWKTLLALRTGRYYDKVGVELLHHLNNCKYYRYDAADIAYTGGPSDIVRRLLMTFSLRPIKVKTLPWSNPKGQALTLNTPFVNYEMQNGEVDTLPMVNIRLGMIKEDDPIVSIQDVLQSSEFFFDKVSKVIVPKMTQLMSANNLLIVNVYRHQIKIPLVKMNGPFTFRDLPTFNKDYYAINTIRVSVPLDLALADNTFHLRSAVLAKLVPYTDNMTGQTNTVPQGCYSIILPQRDSAISANECYMYDPLDANKNDSGLGPIQIEPFTDTTTSKLDQYLRLCEQGEILVYVNDTIEEKK